jgi:hypothetical protein
VSIPEPRVSVADQSLSRQHLLGPVGAGLQLGKVTEKLGKVRKFNGVRTLSLTL